MYKMLQGRLGKSKTYFEDQSKVACFLNRFLPGSVRGPNTDTAQEWLRGFGFVNTSFIVNASFVW